MGVRFEASAVRTVYGTKRYQEIVLAYFDHPDIERFEEFFKREYPAEYLVVTAMLRLVR